MSDSRTPHLTVYCAAPDLTADVQVVVPTNRVAIIEMNTKVCARTVCQLNYIVSVRPLRSFNIPLGVLRIAMGIFAELN